MVHVVVILGQIVEYRGSMSRHFGAPYEEGGTLRRLEI